MESQQWLPGEVGVVCLAWQVQVHVHLCHSSRVRRVCICQYVVRKERERERERERGRRLGRASEQIYGAWVWIAVSQLRTIRKLKVWVQIAIVIFWLLYCWDDLTDSTFTRVNAWLAKAGFFLRNCSNSKLHAWYKFYCYKEISNIF